MQTAIAPACRLLSLLLLLAATGGCARDEAATLEPDGGYPDRFVDARPLVADIADARLAPTPGGAILHVTGVAQTQGWWDIGLRRARGDDDTPQARTYDLRGRPPVDADGNPLPAAIGPVALRAVDTAVFLSDTDLDGLRRITVRGAQTSRSLRR